MKTKTYSFSYPDDQTYLVEVTYKRQRGLYLRKKGDTFYASAPLLMSESHVKDFIYKSIPKLNKRIQNRQVSEPPIGENYTYLLGEKVDHVIDEKELRKFALEKITSLVRISEEEMNILRPYKVHIHKTKTRYGSNSSKTHSLNFQLDLIHFSEEIIRSVVIHELAHDKYRNHQQGFYKLVLQYCPNYLQLRKKLRKGIYK